MSFVRRGEIDRILREIDKLKGKRPVAGGGGPGGGDMLKAIYDINNNGIVDDAEKIDGRKIYVSDSAPTPADGQDGDIWLEY